MLKKLAAVVLAASMAACGVSLPPINPPNKPTPPPAPAECMADVPWCHEAGLTCSTAERPCKHNPTSDPNHCELAPTCGGEQPPQPPATRCQPALDAAHSAPVAEDGEWPLAADQSVDSAWKQAVFGAVREAQAMCPAAWSGDCLSGGAADIDHGYLLISKALQSAGVDASQGRTPSGEVKDHLWVRRSPGSADWNATKLFFYGNGCLITGDGAFTAHGWYTYGGAAPTPPPQPPPVTGTCPVGPCPELTWTEATLPDGWGRDEIGRARMHFNSSVYVGRCEDNTLLVTRNEPYCASIGMSPMANGILRDACPLRPDGHPDRVALETWASQGFRVEGENGARCDPCPAAPDNPVMFALGSRCRICTVRTFKNGEPLCSEWH